MKRQWLLCVLVMLGMGFPVAGGAQEKGTWRAASSTAKSITGDVAFSSVKISIDLYSYWIAQIRVLQPGEIRAVFPAESEDGGGGNLYRLSIPGTKTFLHKNTICGEEDTQWIATYAVGHTLQLAFFSGDKMPVLTPEALANATEACGTFSYVR